MLRRDALAAGLIAGVVATSGCLGGSDGPSAGGGFEEGFEDGIGDWESGVAIGPEVDVEEFEWELGVSDAEAASGDRALRIWNEGRTTTG